jgi:hypothetical protein
LLTTNIACDHLLKVGDEIQISVRHRSHLSNLREDFLELIAE